MLKQPLSFIQPYAHGQKAKPSMCPIIHTCIRVKAAFSIIVTCYVGCEDAVSKHFEVQSVL